MKRISQKANTRSRNANKLAGQPVKFSDQYISLMVSRTPKVSSALDKIRKNFHSQKEAVEAAIIGMASM